MAQPAQKLDATQHYQGKAGEKYYAECQKNRSDKIDQHKADFLSQYIKPSDEVLDFGCGRGGILSKISCAKRYGLEINPAPAADARANGLEIFSDPKDIPDHCVDVVMSNHCLEHIINVHEIIADFKRILKPGGRLVLIVPGEKPNSRFFNHWHANDMDKHLYAWTPLAFGNLVSACGFDVQDSYFKPLGYSRYIEFLFPVRPLYNLARSAVSLVMDRYEICLTAKLPD